MHDAFSSMFHAINLAIGLAVFLGLMWWIAKANSHWWRAVGTRYRGTSRGRRLARKTPETLVITARGKTGGLVKGNVGFRVYGASRIAIHEDGLVLTQIPPFNVMCAPLFLPFGEMDLTETDWGFNRAYAFRMDGLSDIDIIVYPRVVRWIRGEIDEAPFGLGV